MYCIAISKCGLWEHCVQAALYEAQPLAWHMLQCTHFMFKTWNSMSLGIPLINVINLVFSYIFLWLALLIA